MLPVNTGILLPLNVKAANLRPTAKMPPPLGTARVVLTITKIAVSCFLYVIAQNYLMINVENLIPDLDTSDRQIN